MLPSETETQEYQLLAFILHPVLAYQKKMAS